MTSKPWTYEKTVSALRKAAKNMSAARAKTHRVRESRANGEINFTVGGTLVAIHRGSDGTLIAPEIESYL